MLCLSRGGGRRWPRAWALVSVFSLTLVIGVAPGCAPPTGEGKLQVAIADDFELERSWEEYELILPNGKQIALGTKEPLGLKQGTRIAVTGDWENPFRIKNAIVTPVSESWDDAIETTRRPLIPTTPPVPRKVAVIMINFTDLVMEPLTLDQVRERVFTSATSTKAYFTENFYGWVILEGRDNPTGDVLGWYTIPSASTPCNDTMWGNQGIAAAQAAGIDTAGYDHFVFWWPRTTACSYGGKGATGGGTRAPTGTFSFGRNTWINSNTGGNVVSHEFGHNFRMSHSGTRTCTDAGGARVTMSDTCTTSEYGSRFDVMGSGGHKHSIVYGKGRAGVIGPPNVLTVQQGGTYAIQPLEKGLACGVQAIRIARSANEYYYVDYRQPLGFDATYGANVSAINGVVITIGPDYVRTYGNTGQLDMTPATTSFDDGALVVGQTFTDPANLVTITLESRDANAANVRVAFPGGDVGANLDGCTGGGGAGGTVVPGTGGRAGTGGTVGAGGRAGTGGTVGAGGRVGTGGTTPATGGTGVLGTGGTAVGSGGTPAGTGGSTPAGTGGASSSDGGSPPGAAVGGGCACRVSGADRGTELVVTSLAALGFVPFLRRRSRRKGR